MSQIINVLVWNACLVQLDRNSFRMIYERLRPRLSTRRVRKVLRPFEFDLSVFAEGMSQEMGDIGLPLVLFRDGGDMNGSIVGAHA